MSLGHVAQLIDVIQHVAGWHLAKQYVHGLGEQVGVKSLIGNGILARLDPGKFSSFLFSSHRLSCDDLHRL